MDGVVEIVTGRERWRRWSVNDKLRLMAEMEESGARRPLCEGSIQPVVTHDRHPQSGNRHPT